MLVNLRDVASAHPSLAPGVLLRSDAPLAGDDHSGYPVVWPPRTVVDLRRPGERHPHPLEEYAAVVSLPVGGRASYDDVEAADEAEDAPIASISDLYLRMIGGRRAEAVVAAITHIAERPAPVLVHCTAGKDRTGVTVALALLLVGVDAESVAADYARTHPAMDAIFARISATVAGAEGDPRGRIPVWLQGAPIEEMRTFLAGVEERYGGAERWFLSSGGTEATIDALRRRLLAAG